MENKLAIDFTNYWYGDDSIGSLLQANEVSKARELFQVAVGIMPKIGLNPLKVFPGDDKNLIQAGESPFAIFEAMGGRDDYFPFSVMNAYAFASCINDTKSLDILDSITDHFEAEPRPCGSEYLSIVADINSEITNHGAVNINIYRKSLSKTNRIRLRFIWRALRALGIYSVDSRKQNVTLYKDGPLRVSCNKDRFSDLADFVGRSPRLIESTMEADGSNVYLDSLEEIIESGAAQLRKTDTSDNRYSKYFISKSMPVGECTWIQRLAPKKSGTDFFMSILVVDSSGIAVASFDLPQGKLYSSPQGDCAVMMDKNMRLHIYSQMGAEVFECDLRGVAAIKELICEYDQTEADLTQDFNYEVSRTGLSISSAIKSFASKSSEQIIAVSVINHVLLYDYSGNVVGFFKMEDVRHVESFDILEVIEAFEDWVYFLQFSIDGKSLFIGCYSGKLFKVGFDGEIFDSWTLPECPEYLQEFDGHISGGSRSHLFKVSLGESTAILIPFDDEFEFTLLDQRVLLSGGGKWCLFDLDLFEANSLRIQSQVRNVLSMSNTIFVETLENSLVFES